MCVMWFHYKQSRATADEAAKSETRIDSDTFNAKQRMGHTPPFKIIS